MGGSSLRRHNSFLIDCLRCLFRIFLIRIFNFQENRMKKLIFLILLPLFLFAQNVKQVELNDVKGDLFILKDHLNHDATVVTFWATWCLPCQKEHPALEKIKKKYGDKDIQIIAISLDSPRSLAKVKKYVRTRRYDFVFLVDPNGEVSQKLLVTDIPFTMLVDKKGKVVFTHSGYRKGDESELEKAMQKLWQGKQPPGKPSFK